jgi:hypothetical protein
LSEVADADEVQWWGADRHDRLLQPLAYLGAESVGAGEQAAVAEQREEAVGVRVAAGVEAVLATSEFGTVLLKRASVAPTFVARRRQQSPAI